MNGERIYSYQIRSYTAAMRSNAVTSFAKDKVFLNAMTSLGIMVSDEMVDEEYQKYAKRHGEDQESVQDKTTIKKTILQQKAFSYFAEKESPTEEEITVYFEKHSADFPKGLEQEMESVRLAVKAEQGEKAYNSYIEQAEQSTVIKLY